MFNIELVRKEFPMLNGLTMDGYPLVYLDSGATALKPQCVIDVVTLYYTTYSTNAHRGDYSLSHHTDTQYEKTRSLVAQLLNAQTKDEIVFTSGTTASINLLANGLRKQLKKGDVILISEFEHASNVLPWFALKEEIGIEIEYVSLDEDGILTNENFLKAMHDKVKIVALAQVSNVLGYEIDVAYISKITHQYNAFLVIDGAQSVPHQKVDVQALDIDFLAFSGHKLGGPSGIGVLYGKYELLNNLEPYILGGGMNNHIYKEACFDLKQAPYKFEAGTPAIEATIGMGSAISFLMELGLDNVYQHIKDLRAYAIKRIKEETKNVILYNEKSISGPITFNIKGYENAKAQDIGSSLANKGIALRTGEHCAKLLVDVIKSRGSVRASLYYYNNIEDMDRLVDALIEIEKGDVLDWLL